MSDRWDSLQRSIDSLLKTKGDKSRVIGDIMEPSRQRRHEKGLLGFQQKFQAEQSKLGREFEAGESALGRGHETSQLEKEIEADLKLSLIDNQAAMARLDKELSAVRLEAQNARNAEARENALDRAAAIENLIEQYRLEGGLAEDAFARDQPYKDAVVRQGDEGLNIERDKLLWDRLPDWQKEGYGSLKEYQDFLIKVQESGNKEIITDDSLSRQYDEILGPILDMSDFQYTDETGRHLFPFSEFTDEMKNKVRAEFEARISELSPSRQQNLMAILNAQFPIGEDDVEDEPVVVPRDPEILSRGSPNTENINKTIRVAQSLSGNQPKQLDIIAPTLEDVGVSTTPMERTVGNVRGEDITSPVMPPDAAKDFQSVEHAQLWTTVSDMIAALKSIMYDNPSDEKLMEEYQLALELGEVSSNQLKQIKDTIAKLIKDYGFSTEEEPQGW